MPTGVYSMADLLAIRFSSAKAFGLDTIAQVLQRDLDAHNAIVQQMLTDLADTGTDARRLYGGTNNTAMVEVDEFGRSATQKQVPGAETGFPLRLFQYATGFTRKYLENATPADLAIKQNDAEKAHLRAIETQIKKAIFANGNYTFVDFLVDNVSLAVKRFVNADSAPIPDGPNGETFTPSSHTHFTFATPFTAALLTAEIYLVMEHGHGTAVKVYINQAQETLVRGFTGFVAYVDPRIISASGVARTGTTLDITRTDNRAIGIFGAAEIWVKSWIPAGYIFCFDSGDSRKPLYMRVRNAGGQQLRLAAEFDTFPLQANFYECEFGVAVWTRTNGAVHYQGAAWSDATIT